MNFSRSQQGSVGSGWVGLGKFTCFVGWVGNLWVGLGKCTCFVGWVGLSYPRVGLGHKKSTHGQLWSHVW